MNLGEGDTEFLTLEYARGDKLYVPVENIDVLSRYGSESEGVALDRLGGEAWQKRRSRLKERIREIARMSGGVTITPETLRHAESMLA